MEREIMELRNQLAGQNHTASSSPISQTHLGLSAQGNNFGLNQPTFGQPVPQISPSPLDQYMGSHEAVASLLDLKSGGDSVFGRSPTANARPSRRLEGVVMTYDQVEELFRVSVTMGHRPCIPEFLLITV